MPERAGWEPAASVGDARGGRRPWETARGSPRGEAGRHSAPRGRRFWGPQSREPRRSLDFFLLTDQDVPARRVPAMGARLGARQARREGGARGSAWAAAPGGLARWRGRRALPAPRAHTGAHTAHTHLELVPGGGRGGEPERVS